MLVTWHSISHQSLQSFVRESSSKEDALALSEKIPKAMKRRLTDLGRLVINTLYESIHFFEKSSIDSEIPWVFSSRHGDGDRAGRLLRDIAKDEMLSPMDFSQSVHNAIAGTFSIMSKNTKMHTALSAGKASFELGFLEAYALQRKTNSYVGYAHYGASMPADYDSLIQEDLNLIPFCLVMILGPDKTSFPKENRTISVTYSSNAPENSNPALSLQEIMLFFNNNSPDFSLSVGGGCFDFKKTSSR